MNDLISRQAAIDALAEQMPKPYTPDGSHPADEGIFAAQEIYADCIQTLEALPSAQPGVPDTNAGDMISRQVNELKFIQSEVCDYYALCRHDRDENKLRARLGVCEYCNKDSDGYVKPIEKNNHAFVRFGINGWELSLKANGWHGSAKIRYCPMCGRDLLVK